MEDINKQLTLSKTKLKQPQQLIVLWLLIKNL